MTPASASDRFAIPGAPHGSEAVLVVEDEPIVRELVVSMLELQGYEVLSAGNASDALRLADATTGRIDLLLTDVHMPDMSGLTLAERLRAGRPDVRLVFMSGYGEMGPAGESSSAAGAPVLAKPFTPAELAHQVRAALDGARR